MGTVDPQKIASVRQKLEQAVRNHHNDRVFEALGEVAGLLPGGGGNSYASLLASNLAAGDAVSALDAHIGGAPARTESVISLGEALPDAAARARLVPLRLSPRRTLETIGATPLEVERATGEPPFSETGRGMFATPDAAPGKFRLGVVTPDASWSEYPVDLMGGDKLALVGPILLRWIGDSLERWVEEKRRSLAAGYGTPETTPARWSPPRPESGPAETDIAGIGHVLEGWTTRTS